MPDLKKTPLYDLHLKLGARIIEFGGWLMPVSYTSIIEEHNTTRNKAGLFDVSHMGEILVEGERAHDFLQKMVTRDISKFDCNKSFYCCLCNPMGGVIDDLFVYKFNDKKFMLVVNASNVDKDFGWLMKNKDFFDDVTIINISNNIAKIDLQGPFSEQIINDSFDFDFSLLRRFDFIEKFFFNENFVISRTGYTAEDGFEIYFNSGRAIDVWNRLLKCGKDLGLKPVGLGARDTLRIEACYSLYGHELNENINPFEAGIGFVVDFSKDFIGKEALLEAKRDLKRIVVPFELLDKAIPRFNYDVFKNNRKIGLVTSGTFSPTFKKPIGLAILDIAEADVGSLIEIKIRGELHKAKIVERPFYKYKGKLNK